jgi:hypothetical protein
VLRQLQPAVYDPDMCYSACMSEDQGELERLSTFLQASRLAALAALLAGVWTGSGLAFVVEAVAWLAAAFFGVRIAAVQERLGVSGRPAQVEAAIHVLLAVWALSRGDGFM